jgi:hypothetical protein
MFTAPTTLLSAASAYEWLGKFDIMPQTPAESELWLGIDGSLTANLSAISHFWRPKAANASDIGTGTTYNMTGASGGPTYALDADYELGAAGKQVMVKTGDNDGQWTDTGASIPVSPATDTFRSFMLCSSFTPSAANSVSATRTAKVVAFSKTNLTPYPGWSLFMANQHSAWGGVGNELIFRLSFGASINTLRSAFALTLDLPVFVTVVVDFAVAKMMMIVAQGVNLIYVEGAITHSGSFLNAYRTQIGTHTGLAGAYGGILGKYGLMNTFEWPAATPSGFTTENVKRYLKYTDGVLA